MENDQELANAIYQLAVKLFPICRSLSGNGVRETFSILKQLLPALETFEVPTGTKCFDWEVPNEWNISDAYVISPSGEKIIDFKKSNLSVVGYSEPVDLTLSLDELQKHLYSLPEQPDVIPYVTSYYRRNWGFCLPDRIRSQLAPGNYQVRIDSTHAPGSLTYGELILPGKSSREVFLSTYICHPSMGNNELSGPVVTTYLARWLNQLSDRKYTYRIAFVPETIGSIIYLSRNLEQMKKAMVAGFNVTCIGDDRCYSYLPSRQGTSLSDRAALHVLKHLAPDFKRYTYLDRGSDERQYCSPHVDLPVATVMRSKYGQYPEYHTSDDNLSLISPAGLYGGYNALKQCLLTIERNEILDITVLGEPQLGPRGLYPQTSVKGSAASVRTMMNMLAYCDGTKDLLEIAEVINAPIFELFESVDKLKEAKLLISRDV